MNESLRQAPEESPPPTSAGEQERDSASARPVEVGGRKDGTEPTRFGDWEKNGRCVDF